MSGIDSYNRERWPMLQIHNTISRKKEEFKPINEGQIGMYVCGVTVYDLCHIGHARTFVNFDMVVRYLRYRGYKVRYIRNITDIDDKIIKRANERKVSAKELAENFIVEMHKDFDALNIMRPDEEPRATETISEIIALVQRLILHSCENGHCLADRWQNGPEPDENFCLANSPHARREVRISESSMW